MNKSFKRIYRKLKDYNFRKISSSKKINILWYPAITTQEELNRELARLVWYCYPINDRINKVEMIVDQHLDLKLATILEVPSYCDSKISIFFQDIRQKIILSRKIIDIYHYDIVVMWKNCHSIKMKQFYPYVIDARVYENQFEANQLLRLSNIFIDKETEKYHNKRLKKFLHNLGQNYKGEVYLLGSGPSLQNLQNINFNVENSFSIICNSVVKNIDLLKKVNPKIVVASDAVFHSGYSKYAAEFRASLIQTLELFPEMMFIVPLRDYFVYKSNLPQKYIERIIAVETKNINTYNINLIKKQTLKSTSNVLTAFLLPIAATVSKNITLVGFDGKTKEDKDVFWQYDKKSQFIESIDYTKKAHPAFYKVDYADYYKKHTREIEKLIKTLKAKKYKLSNIGLSNIPVLNFMDEK